MEKQNNFGRDENVSKMADDSVDGRRPKCRPEELCGRRRPVENVSARRRPVGKAQSGRCRPVEKLSGRQT